MARGETAASPDWARCEAVAREHGRTFYFASRFLPRARREAMLAAYAWCRIADDIVDRASDDARDAVDEALVRWEAQIDAPIDPIAVAFAAARDRYAIPVEPARNLIAGLRMDLERTRYATWTELRTYCHLVAGTVGLISAPALGCRESWALKHAADLGIAMQLTNILRDVGEDARRGRLYLPLDDLARFGCDPDAVLAGRLGSGFAAVMAFEIARAREIYAGARAGLRALAPSGRATALAAATLYARILDEIEAIGFDVFATRAHVSTAKKARAVPGILTDFVSLSLTRSPRSRTVPPAVRPSLGGRRE